MNSFNAIISKSPVLDTVIRSAKIAAATDVTILLKGETGTGKEILATAIHQASARADKAFIALNCAALAESLIESSLFGHKKGSFTGATSAHEGIFQAANGGTLFLDEINSLPITVQAKLLRVIETGECMAVGDTEAYTVDVRIIAASNANLEKQIADGEFRRDLYFRLNVVPLELPPLNQRAEDIDYLVAHFLTVFEKTHHITAPKFSKQSLKALKAYHWPGNIRELRNLCERLCILLADRVIEPENLPLEFSNYKNHSPSSNDFVLPESGLYLDNLEADLIHQALNRTKGNRSKSAKLLGLTRDTLLYRMQKHGFATH
ncbi:sigma-54 interaction domain-containing protein [Crenothrix sp.]|uniref:sigma-54 interaction domain-containing protein n=1 Tax=Crenothrix sp. TaxID=3100433 RepID=UPI00374DE412